MKTLAQAKPEAYQRDIKGVSRKEIIADGIVYTVEGLPPDMIQSRIRQALDHVAGGVTNAHQDTWIKLNDAALVFDFFHDALSPADRRTMTNWINGHMGVYTEDDEDTSSYDYGAAIGQAGDLRPTYYRFKRTALFARSFQTILEDSDDATDTYKSVATDAGIRVTARQSPSGTILFLDNNGKEPIKTQVKETDGTLFPTSGPVTIAPGQIVPVVRD